MAKNNKENENNRDTEMLYKYRSLQNFELVADIIKNNRLYAASYKNMNDPMEGFYYFDGKLDGFIKDQIYSEKSKLKICSLSIDNNDPLMWGHYANGNKGVVLGVRINKSKIEIKYDENLPIFGNPQILNAKDILSYKTTPWSYEKEWRVFSDKEFIECKVDSVYFGIKTSSENIDLLRCIIEKYNPTIKIYQQTREFNFRELPPLRRESNTFEEQTLVQ